MLYQWFYTVCKLWGLTFFFCQHNSLGIDPWSCEHQQFLLPYWWVVFHEVEQGFVVWPFSVGTRWHFWVGGFLSSILGMDGTKIKPRELTTVSLLLSSRISMSHCHLMFVLCRNSRVFVVVGGTNKKKTLTSSSQKQIYNFYFSLLYCCVHMKSQWVYKLLEF